MGDLVRRHETGVFVALTFGLAWALWLLSGILGRSDLRAPDWRWAVAQVGVFAPALALHTGINTIPDFAMRDPGRYERAMGLYVVLMLALGIAVALLDRRLRRPVAALSTTAPKAGDGLTHRVRYVSRKGSHYK